MSQIVLYPKLRTSTNKIGGVRDIKVLFHQTIQTTAMKRTNITFKSERGPLTKARSATKRISICHYE
jgi:hypothetical protein